MTGMNRFFLAIALFALAAVSAVATVSAAAAPNLVACCRANNDLYRMFLANGIRSHSRKYARRSRYSRLSG